MVIGTDLVLIWVSIIPVESLGLGLLLGRDWLEGVGCVLSFSKKIMRADGRTFCIAIDPFGVAQAWFLTLASGWTGWGCCIADCASRVVAKKAFGSSVCWKPSPRSQEP